MELDLIAIRRLIKKADQEPINFDIAEKWMKQDYGGFGKWMADEYGLYIPPCYLAIYTTELAEDGGKIGHLSVSASLSTVPVRITIEQAERIADAFGLGDRHQWDELLPPKPGQSAFNIAKRLS